MGEGEEMDDEELEVEDEEEFAMESLKNRVSNLLESYIDKRETKKEYKRRPKGYLKNRLQKITQKRKIKESYLSVEQELSTEKFLKENRNFNFVGKTKRGAIILSQEDKKVFVDRVGVIQ